MEPNQNNHEEPKKETRQPIDLDAILLPKKEVHTSQSADRVDAAEVLADQQTPFQATAPKLPDIPEPVTPAVEGVKPLETYQGDIQAAVERNNVSVVSIAAAEANRRAQQPLTAGTATSFIKTTALLVLGVLILSAAAGLILYAIMTGRSVPTPTQPSTPIISVDTTEAVVLATSTSATDALGTLTQASAHLSLPLGLVERLLVTTDAVGQQAMDAQTFLSIIAPNAPQTLIDTLQPSFVLGVYAYPNNEPFLIFTIDSYTQAYAGMLAWEPTMQQDLSPLFGTTTASTQQSTTTAQAVLQSPFVDGILQNHDVREIVDSAGNPSLLWTFLDAHTLVITTSNDTLHQIITRLTQAPVTQ